MLRHPLPELCAKDVICEYLNVVSNLKGTMTSKDARNSALLVVLVGIPAAGKSSLCRSLAEQLASGTLLHPSPKSPSVLKLLYGGHLSLCMTTALSA